MKFHMITMLSIFLDVVVDIKLGQKYFSLFSSTLFALAKTLNPWVRFAFCFVYMNCLFHNLMVV